MVESSCCPAPFFYLVGETLGDSFAGSIWAKPSRPNPSQRSLFTHSDSRNEHNNQKGPKHHLKKVAHRMKNVAHRLTLPSR